ncbi:hypothetical protein C1J03_22615 [Sulfitobacter sp. SK012]|uniref:hypothetical protein n=1 Tax=Sulfitobacter sp. SK012 TaxID=1389005 RepID=UPI000E0B9E68|nr:hypothetical protein [Sulfitobacter sp. SK012]AXI48540.1 hypothetical protein C1J03_22615 [Sulfitobacter sp. SK012]
MNGHTNTLQIVGPKDQFPKVTLMEPVSSGYVMLALEGDHRPPIGFFIQSGRKTRLIGDLKALAQSLWTKRDVLDVSVFKALIVPPGRGAFLKKRPNVEVARFDIVMLVEFGSLEAAQRVSETPQWQETFASAEQNSHKSVNISATNTRHIGPVDHSRDGVFLFNYFYAESLDINLKFWNYTAGWLQGQTGHDNSTVLLPHEASKLPYTIINHCRWDRLS